MAKTISSRLPWEEILDASRRKETPWVDKSTNILVSIEQLNLDSDDLGRDKTLPLETLDKISQLFDEELKCFEEKSYYLKVSMYYDVYQTLVGVLLRQVLDMKPTKKEEIHALTQLAQAIMLRSVKHIPYTIDMWREMAELLLPEAQPIFEDILSRMEVSIMVLTGNTVYSFFEDTCTHKEIDKLLLEAQQAVAAAEQVRQFSDFHGNGHTRLILHYVQEWQEDYVLKKMPTITPFLRCLEAHWKHTYKLGCRQGAERMYKVKCR